MQRHTFAMQIKKGELLNYRKTLGEVWPEVKKLFDTYNLRNFSLWSVDLIVFGYYESDDDFEATDDFLTKINELDSRFGNIYDWISEPGKPMRLMFHNYGGIQEEKELVHKKIFVIHLFKGMADEYKRRHDEVLPTPEEEAKHILSEASQYAAELVFVDELPESGEASKLYIDKATSSMYYWNGEVYMLLNPTPECDCNDKEPPKPPCPPPKPPIINCQEEILYGGNAFFPLNEQ